MREHQAALVELGLQALTVHARFGGHGERGLVHLDDAVEPLEVEGNSSLTEDGPSLAPRAPSPRDDRDVVLVREQENRGDVFV